MIYIKTSLYGYGFQGQETDDELKGEGNSVNYKYRMHDPRIGRFFAIDPLFRDYPHYTPYSFSGNKVIAHVELEGLEELYYGELNNDKRTSTAFEIMKSTDVGLEVIQEVWKTEGTERQTDVYFIFADLSNENKMAFTTHFDPSQINPKNGKLKLGLKPNISKTISDSGAFDVDFSISKKKDNNIALIVVNTSGRVYKDAADGSYSSSLYLSETLYHEIKAHVCSRLCPIEGDEKSGEQEHFRYHGVYSKFSPQKEQISGDTPAGKYLEAAEEVIKMYEELMRSDKQQNNKSDENSNK